MAWDPVKQIKVWEQPQPEFWNPGTMVTAGDVVFQGSIDGSFSAYHAVTGEKLWSVNLGSGISAPPITYEVDGKQYVSLLVGFGGAGVSFVGGEALRRFGWAYGAQVRQLYTFALDGKAALPKVGDPVVPKPLVPADFKVDPDKTAKGEALYIGHCSMCHGAGAASGGYAPDLRASPLFASPPAMTAVVRDGMKVPNGMPAFKELTDADLEDLQHFVRSRAELTVKPASEAKKSD